MKHDDDDDSSSPSTAAPSDIAVVGMACRFPGADGVEAFWRNLREGVESIRFFSDAELEAEGIPAEVYKQPEYVRAHGVLDDYDLFDAGFFGYPPREAEITDPQQRVFLELAYHALEDAGYDPERYKGLIGVWGGATLSHYLLALAPLRDRLHTIGVDTTMLSVGNDKDSVAPRISYKLNLRGPSMTVQTACSTSLVAIHVACQSLLMGESDMALAGAISITIPMKQGYFYQEGGILSPDGHCRPFDARAQGTIFGCGGGIVVLKRLEDALEDGDTIHAVIRGSAINNDGATKAGFTAPSVTGQAEVISEALANAGVEADSIGFVEGHGTATALGDPVEVAALTRAFRRGTDRTGYCALGSVKSNFGHLEAAAGIAGFIKAALAVRHGEIPPSLHFEKPNPQIDFDNSPFFVNTDLAAWPEDASPRRAGVSSFGFGGTNTHIILEEPPAAVADDSDDDRPWQLLVLSARTPTALDAATRNLARHFDEHPETGAADAAYTLQIGRRIFEHRRALAVRDVDDALRALAQGDPNRILTGSFDGKERQVCFLFPGQGAQHPGMAGQTYRSEPVFRDHFDRCAELFRPHIEVDLQEFLTADLQAWLAEGPEGQTRMAARLNRTDVAQAALFAVEYALAKLWQSWGVQPKAMMGNSLGEYVAACLAGVFSLEDAVKLVAARGRLMATLPEGDMLAVTLPEAELLPLLGDDMSLSAVHGPDLCVVAGSKEAARQLAETLAERGIEARELHTSHAFHSAMMDPILDAFTEEVRKISLKAPRIPFVSNVTGKWITPAEATSPAYWSRHVRRTVRLADGFATLLSRPGAVLLEVGPAQAMSGAARQSPARAAGQPVLASFPHPKDPRGDAGTLIQALGGLWVAGVDVDWDGFHAGRKHHRIPLPGYPFERKRHYIDFEKLAGTSTGRTAGTARAAVTAETAAPIAMQATPVVPPPAPPSPPPSSARASDPTAAQRATSYVGARYGNVEPEEQGFVGPRNEVEEIVADIWQTLLGVERVGIHDNFFSLNGNSLIALQAIARIQAVFGVKLSVRSFFETPTVSQLAKIVAERQPGLEALAEKARILEEIRALSQEAVQSELAVEPPPPPATAVLPPAPHAGEEGSVAFSVIFFSGDEDMFPQYKYQLVVDAAKFADQNGFTAIWTPERHFHSFGGLYPSPPVLSGALAMVTERLQLRSGSVVLPLHNPIRVAEDWAVVDNLSRGRIGISLASGFHPNDFTFAPETYANRRDVMFEKLEVVRRLWRGEKVRVQGGAGNEIDVEIFPKPVQKELPVWITCSNNPQTFEMTGTAGANVLSSLIGLSVEKLAERIQVYREARARAGFDPKTGQVAVMLHTFVGEDLEQVKEKVRAPFCGYLRSHTELLTSLTKSINKGFDDSGIDPEALEELLNMEFERYFYTGSLLGTPESCLTMVRRLQEIGVDEICCLLDFGVDVPSVIHSLQHLAELKRLSGQEVLVAG